MRWLIWAVAAAGLLWSGVWFAASSALRQAAQAAAQGLAERGLAAAPPAVAVRGFPNRLDLTLTEVSLHDPESGWGYDAPFLQVFALVYRPWHVIAAFPPQQGVALPDGGRATLTAGKLQASVVAEPAAALPLDRFALAGETLALTHAPPPGAEAAAPATITAATLRIASRRDPSRANWHELGLDLRGLAPDPAFFAALPPGRDLPPAIARLRIVAFAGLSAPIDRHLAETRPTLTGLDLREGVLDWGPVQIFAQGRLAPDAQGLAEGRIEIRIGDWAAALDAAVAAGLVRPEIAPTWAEFARRLAETSPDPARLDLPLTYARGRVSLGPIPLGPAPNFGG